MKLGQMWPQKLHIVGDLRHRSYRGAGRFDGVALFKRDGWRNALNAVHARLVHAVEKLASVGRKRFDITPLPFRVERIKCQRTLARPAQPCDHNELAQRQIQIKTLQVIVSDSAQTNHWIALRSLHWETECNFSGEGVKQSDNRAAPRRGPVLINRAQFLLKFRLELRFKTLPSHFLGSIIISAMKT